MEVARVKLGRKRNMDLSPERGLFITYAKSVAANARVRAKNRGLPWDIDEHTIDRLLVDQRWRCALTGLPLESPGGRDPFAPSLDRIVPSLGYVEGNVRVVCNIVNFAMNEWGEGALMKMAKALAGKGQAMSDLPSRLRYTRGVISSRLCNEAAAEIERLHALLDGDAAEIMRLIRENERLRRALEQKP